MKEDDLQILANVTKKTEDFWYKDIPLDYTPEEISWMKGRGWTKSDYGMYGCTFGSDSEGHCTDSDESSTKHMCYGKRYETRDDYADGIEERKEEKIREENWNLF